MKKLLVCILMLLAYGSLQAVDVIDPLANSDAVVVSGRARFTVLTPQMIRIQYSTSSAFEDRATFAVINRRLPVPQFTTREEGGYLYIETSALKLRYRLNSVISPLLKSPNNLNITLKVDDRTVTWYPGKEDALNLKGTKRTLDTASGDNQRPDLEDGVISRAGWAIVDESPSNKRGDGSTTFAFEQNVDGIDWVAEPVDKQALDWYFMGYGHEYKQAIGDYIKIAGRQPLPPLYVLGYWYSKYQAYTQQDFIGLVNDMSTNNMPIDVMIFDMDWHLDGWTGWTWNKKLIPNPVGLINWMHQRGLKVALNLHPADGVANYEDHFAEMCSDLGFSSTVDRIPWNLESPNFYRSMFKRIIRDREKQGVDFWWIDWQQNLTSDYIQGLSETFWCNHVFFNDMRINRTDRRPFIFHRWGGLGSHRYPIGFSGDTYGTFGSLAFQPYFTATASNVCFGYWGHDIGGHLQIGEKNPELMLRWLQFGVFSPIFRTHGASQAGNERRLWMYENFPLLLDCVNLRYQLMPYIYTAARQAYDTGISICRPLYYEWPDENEAYRAEGEYMFGDDILVSPIVTAAEDGEMAFQKTWIPEGLWFNVCRNELVEGDRYVSDWYRQEEIPYFYRAGSIIPCNPVIKNLKTRPSELLLKVVPGADGSYSLYEDEGDTQEYINGKFTTTMFSQQRTSNDVTLTIHPREGQFEGMPAERSYTVMFLAEQSPKSVTVNDVVVDDWVYDEAQQQVIVNVPSVSCDAQVVVRLMATSTGIDQLEGSHAVVSYESFDLLGRKTKVSNTLSQSHKGISIRRTVTDDGKVHIQKITH